MPVNGMNVGADYSFMYYDGTSGQLINLGDVQDVSITADKSDINSRPYNNVPRFGYVPEGFRIEFTITRTGADLENFILSQAQAFNNGQITQPGYLNETINNPDGSITRYQYTNLVVWMPDHGNISRDRVVTLKLEARASDKVAIT
jgi:hypothetical protein